jgi:hypothetical protein
VRHQFEPAVDHCRTCDEAFCVECLVYSFGADKPPFCVHCALSAAGVRVKGARKPKVSRRELRRREKEAAEAAKAAAMAETAAPVIDWSLPEDGVQTNEPAGAFAWIDDREDSPRPGGIVAF